MSLPVASRKRPGARGHGRTGAERLRERMRSGYSRLSPLWLSRPGDFASSRARGRRDRPAAAEPAPRGPSGRKIAPPGPCDPPPCRVSAAARRGTLRGPVPT